MQTASIEAGSSGAEGTRLGGRLAGRLGGGASEGPGCADVAARPVPPCSTEFPIPDDATMLEQISAVLQQLCDQNSDLRAKCPTIFDSVAKPTMSVHAYLIRIRRYTKFDSLCFLVALAYLRRLCEQHGPSFCPTHHNIHRLFITAVLVASKANDGARFVRPAPAMSTPNIVQLLTPLALGAGRRLPRERLHGAVRRHHERRAELARGRLVRAPAMGTHCGELATAPCYSPLLQPLATAPCYSPLLHPCAPFLAQPCTPTALHPYRLAPLPSNIPAHPCTPVHTRAHPCTPVHTRAHPCTP